MPGDNTRLLATLIIWGACTIIVSIILALLTAASNVEWWVGVLSFIVVLTLLVIVGESTQTIWKYGRSDSDAAPRAKAKRLTQNRVERLVDTLDDDEVYALEELLLARGQDHTTQNGPR
jgi:hypothetical protein